jgi:hypothetical protein
MHRLIEREEARLVTDIDAALLLRELALQGTKLGLRCAFGGKGDGMAFQRLADELAVGNRGQVDRCDEATDLRDDAQQAVFHQALEDLADRGAAYAMLSRKPCLRQRLTRTQAAGQDLIVQPRVEAVAYAARGL